MSKKKKKVNSTPASDWVYDDLMDYFEFCFGGAHVFRRRIARGFRRNPRQVGIEGAAGAHAQRGAPLCRKRA